MVGSAVRVSGGSLNLLAAWGVSWLMDGSEVAKHPGGEVRRRRPFEDVFDEMWRPMVRLAATILDDPEAAQDVAQDAFAKAMGRWVTIDDPQMYLRRAVVNGARSEVRKRIVRRRPLQPPSHTPAGDPLADDTVVAAIRRLSPQRRAVVALRFFEDLTEADIARILDVRVGTVKSTLHAALAELRKEIAR